MNIAHIINRYINVLYFTYLITHTLYSRGKDSEKRWVFAFALCCHSNTTRAPIANPPNSAQLGGIPYHSPKLHPGPCNTVGMRPWTDTHTDTQTRVPTIHSASSTTDMENAEVSCRGIRPFQVRAATTENARSPTMYIVSGKTSHLWFDITFSRM